MYGCVRNDASWNVVCLVAKGINIAPLITGSSRDKYSNRFEKIGKDVPVVVGGSLELATRAKPQDRQLLPIMRFVTSRDLRMRVIINYERG